jgi:hypothetical protein
LVAESRVTEKSGRDAVTIRVLRWWTVEVRWGERLGELQAEDGMEELEEAMGIVAGSYQAAFWGWGVLNLRSVRESKNCRSSTDLSTPLRMRVSRALNCGVLPNVQVKVKEGQAVVGRAYFEVAGFRGVTKKKQGKKNKKLFC